MDSSETASQAAPASHFTITKELALNCDISIACWCPTMDVCAVVSADGQLHLHRMDWQLLWAVAPEALITAICWRPDGKQLAAGHANGTISILNVETGSVVAEHKAHYSALHSLTWSDQADSSSSSMGSRQGLFSPQQSIAPHQRFKRLFVPPVMEPYPPSSTEPLPDPYDMSIEAVGAAAWPAERPGLSLLTAADVRGRISLWLQGQVQVAEVTAAVMGRGSTEGEEQQQAEEEEFKLLHVLATSHLEQVLTVNCSAAGGVVVVAHSLQLLQQHQQPLQQCTALFSHLQSFLKAAVKCVEVAATDWFSATADFQKRFDTQLKQELADHGSSVTVPQQELLLLLATGCCTPPLQSFLANTLGEAGLRRLARAVDSMASGLHTALLERLMPLLELVLFLLGELRGCVACGGGEQPPREAWMGLQVEQVQHLELHAAALLLRTEQLRRSTTAVACQYRAFFTWLLKTMRQLEGQDANSTDASSSSSAGVSLPACQEVLAFLKGQFLHDVIGPELSGSPLSLAAKARAEALFYQGIAPEETHQLLALLMPSHPQAILFAASVGGAEAGLEGTSSPSRTAAGFNAAAGRLSSSLQQQQQQQQHAGPRPAAVQLAAEACSRPLAQQLQHLAALCDEAFEQPLTAISPAVAAPTVQLQLLSNAPSGAAGGQPGDRSGSSSSSNSDTGKLVALSPPLLQPKRCVDLHTYLCCPVPWQLAAGSDVDQQQQLLLVVKLPPAGLFQQQEQDEEQVAAVLLQLPAGQAAAAWQFYKDQQLVVLLRSGPAATTAGQAGSGIPLALQQPRSSVGAAAASSLHLLDLSAAPWAAVQHPPPSGSSNSSSVLEQCLQQQAVIAVTELQQRSRQLHVGASAGHLAVSRSRGLASLVTDMQHLMVMDLEDDEDQGGDEQEEGEEEDADMEEH